MIEIRIALPYGREAVQIVHALAAAVTQIDARVGRECEQVGKGHGHGFRIARGYQPAEAADE